jgi:hypothetical protein
MQSFCYTIRTIPNLTAKILATRRNYELMMKAILAHDTKLPLINKEINNENFQV